MWIMMVQHKTSVSNIRQSINYIHPQVQEIQAFKNFNQILSNADTDANADGVVTAIALPELSYR